jgi:hypothetical protein
MLAVMLGCTEPAGPRANYIFATSTLHTGNLGGLEGADAICATRAAEAGLDGVFTAWISGAAFERWNGSRGWTRVDGVPVADYPSDFASGTTLAPIAVNERGDDLRSGSSRVWTGLQGDGDVSPYRCRDWTSAANTDGGLNGDIHSGGARFTGADVESCDRPGRLICLETGRSRQVAVERTTGRLAFVSTQVWAPSGVAAADAVCQADADQAGVAGSYLAVLSTSILPAASRFDLTGAPWVRADGAELAPTAAQLFTNDFLTTFVNQTATGRVVDQVTWWIDDPLVTDIYNCRDWTSSAGADYGHTGYSHSAARSGRFFGPNGNCADPRPVLCLQQ